ncbi:MAG: sugar phosphate nucleotidyltransferase [Patescibacteria group bacterium]
MKLIIFAGGVGTRLWPLSRENSPKQFDKIYNGKSTIQLAVERVAPVFGIENVFIQTIKEYKNIIKKQVLNFPDNNIIIEPARRNIGPAVCLAAIEMKKRNFSDAIGILWADHLMERVDEFTKALKLGEQLIVKNPNQIIFLGEQPRFANNNLGWIKIGKKAGSIGNKYYYKFEGWKYKPDTEECKKMYKSKKYSWNPGYFITSIEFLINRYKDLAPKIYEKVATNRYSEAKAIHFDTAIIEKVDLSKAVVLKTNMGWSDPGTLYALKEALEKKSNDNVIYGKATTLNTSDSLIYNTDKNKLVATVGLKGMAVVNTPDSLLVVSKDEVVNITTLVKKMKEEGLNKYL